MSKAHTLKFYSYIKKILHFNNKKELKWSLSTKEEIDEFNAQQDTIRSQILVLYQNSKSAMEDKESNTSYEDTLSKEEGICDQAMSTAQKRLSGSMQTAISRIESRVDIFDLDTLIVKAVELLSKYSTIWKKDKRCQQVHIVKI
jgi:hypothetical protein